MTRQNDEQHDKNAGDDANDVADQHALIQQQIESYLAGGLLRSERWTFELHVRDCPACASALASARALGKRLHALFDDAAPSAGFEERIIGRLRAERRPDSQSAGGDRSRLARVSGKTLTPWRRLHPAVRKAALATAAAVMIGGIGYIANSVLTRRLGQELALAPPAGAATSDHSGGDEDQLPFLDTIKAEKKAQRLGDDAMPQADLEKSDTVARWRNPGPVAADRMLRNVHALSLDRDYSKSPQGYGEVDGKDHETKSNVAGNGTSSNVFNYKSSLPFRPADLTQKLELSPTQQSADAVNRPVATSAVPTPKLADWTSDSTASSKDAARQAQIEGVQKQISDAKLHLQVVREHYPASSAEVATEARVVDQLESEAKKLPGINESAQALNTSAEQPQAGDGKTVAAATQLGAANQKIIRTGEMEFEVERFDAAVDLISKIVAEEGGFVGSTNSNKLANGKVRGFITIRVAPERLDTVVLKLRGIGDLKSQKINSQDITRQYTDLESGLRAARAMEERLLDIIKTGKGEVKDLLEAEKQLGVWREKIEQLEGEIRYDNNQVALSTLQLTLEEKDIRSPAYATTREQVTMALETPSVEAAYDKARDAILAAKGRITQSELKQFEAGQFGATIVAELPPDAADGLIGRLKQLDGRVANFQRTTTVASHAPDGGVDPSALIDASRQKYDNVKFSLSMYNLANVAPRRTVTLSVAAADVDEAYRKLIDTAGTLGVRIVASNIDHPRPSQTSANLTLQAPTEKADAMLAAFRALGEIVRSESTDNPDTSNVTDAKRGFQVQIFSLAAATARHTEQMHLAVADVPAVFADLLTQLRSADARIVVSQLGQKDRENISGILEFEMSRQAYDTLRPTLAKTGDILTRETGTAQDTLNTVDSKVHVNLALLSAATQPARQTTTLGVETSDVARATTDWISSTEQAGGRVTGPTQITHDREGTAISRVEVEVPLSQASSMLEQARKLGTIRSMQTDVDVHVSEGRLARGRISVTFGNSAATLGGSQSIGEAMGEAVSISGAALRWCLKLLVLGLCFVVPVALVIGMIWKVGSALLRRRRGAIPQPGQPRPTTLT